MVSIVNVWSFIYVAARFSPESSLCLPFVFFYNSFQMIRWWWYNKYRPASTDNAPSSLRFLLSIRSRHKLFTFNIRFFFILIFVSLHDLIIIIMMNYCSSSSSSYNYISLFSVTIKGCTREIRIPFHRMTITSKRRRSKRWWNDLWSSLKITYFLFSFKSSISIRWMISPFWSI